MSRIRRHWLPWLVVVIVLVGSLGSNLHSDPAGPAVLGVLLALVAVLPVLLERPYAWMLGLSGLCAGTYFVAGFADGPVFVTVPAATFAVALALAPRRWAGWAGLAALLVSAGIVLSPGAARFEGGPWGPGAVPDGDVSLWRAFGQIALVAACGALASALRSRNEARAQRQRRVISEERVRMAADLHDGVGHGLAVIAMQAGAALHVLDRDPAAARRNLEAIRAESKESLDLLRGQLARLTASDPSAPRAPEPGLADVPALVERVRTGGLEVSLRLEAGPVPAPVGRAAYAVVQEGLTNVLRHAGASRAEVVVSTGSADSAGASGEAEAGMLTVTVTDDGRGAEILPYETGSRLGIAGMRSRVERLGGTLWAGPEVRGFRLRASIPLSGSSLGAAGSAEGLA